MNLPHNIWKRRIEEDLKGLYNHPRVGVRNVNQGADEVDFNMILHGAAIILQAGDVGTEHTLHVVMSRDYPYQMPIIKWVSPIWHPNVYPDSSICIGLLKSYTWKDSNNLNEIAMALINFLTSHDATDAANPAARTWYIDHPEKIMEAKKQDKVVEEQLKAPKRIVIKARQTTPQPNAGVGVREGAGAGTIGTQAAPKIRIRKS